MMFPIFRPADILLPVTEPEKWAVIACDQFTSQPEYWEETESIVGDSPSALRLIVPEAYLGRIDEAEAAAEISRTMRSYISDSVLRVIPDSYVYLERTMENGSVRRGIVGTVDLEAYDYTPGTQAPIRATEQTIAKRLPARMAVRKQALLELPHIMLLARDSKVFDRIGAMGASLPLLYDFDLMQGGGRIRGYQLTGEAADLVMQTYSVASLFGGDALIIIGDGNHSLAAAREHWLTIKPTLPLEEQASHPARFCLAELCPVTDESIGLYPIHRVLRTGHGDELTERIRSAIPEGNGSAFRIVSERGACTIHSALTDTGHLTKRIQEQIEQFLSDHPNSEVDYVHGDADACRLGSEPNSLAILMPALRREELFQAADSGVIFPKKCFSIGHAREKRYYFEARAIQPSEP